MKLTVYMIILIIGANVIFILRTESEGDYGKDKSFTR